MNRTNYISVYLQSIFNKHYGFTKFTTAGLEQCELLNFVRFKFSYKAILFKNW